jgi:hypothetical protein
MLVAGTGDLQYPVKTTGSPVAATGSGRGGDLDARREESNGTVSTKVTGKARESRETDNDNILVY